MNLESADWGVVREWWRERVPLARFGPLALFVGLLGGGWDRLWGAKVGLAYTMIVTFRIRDDLADRERDAVVHPERVLVQARSIRPFVASLAIGLALGFVGLSRVHGPARGIAWLGLAAAFELGYRGRLPGRHRWVLLKYPIFAALIGDSLAPTRAGLCYLSLAIHERIDDPTLRSRPDAELRLAGYLFAAALLVAAHIDLGSRP